MTVIIETTDHAVVLELAGGGSLLPGGVVEGLNAAESPSTANPVLTQSAGDNRYQKTPIADSDVPSSIARDTEVTAAIATHAGAIDPHGDRAYAAGLSANYDTAGAASTAVSNHVAATDPHGDRANTTTQIGTHAAAIDPHGDRANTTTQIGTHAAATDPHGDRADAAAKVSAHNSLATAHGLTAGISAALAAAVSPGSSNPVITRSRMAWFDIRDYGALVNGTTDDSAAVVAAIAACVAAGGGVIFFPIGSTLINSQIALPNTPRATGQAPFQAPLTFMGAGTHFSGQNYLQSGGSRVLLNYQGDGTPQQSKIVTYGLGVLSFKNIVLQDTTSPVSSTPFVYSTNTTIKTDDSVSILGNTAGLTCQQDGIVLGGIYGGAHGYDLPTSPFQGYGTTFEGTYFNRVRRAIYMRKYVAQVVVRDCFFDKSCGSNLADSACIEIDGSFDVAADPSPNPLNIVEGNYIEVINYCYGVNLINAVYTSIRVNGFEDGQTGSTFIAAVRCVESTYNYIHDNFCNGLGLVEDAASSNKNDYNSAPSDGWKFVLPVRFYAKILESKPIGVRLVGSTQSIPYASGVAVAFNVETFDTDEMHSNVTNNSRITIKTAGLYTFCFNGTWAANTGGRRIAYMRVNGSTIISYDEPPIPSSGECSHNLPALYQCAVGDYIEVMAYQDAVGGGLNLVGTYLSFSAARLV